MATMKRGRQASLIAFVVVLALSLQGCSSIIDPPGDSDQPEALLKLSQFQSELDKLEERVKAKNLYILKCDNTIKEMNEEIDRLRHLISAAKNETSTADRALKALNEEKKTLLKSLRKLNFDLYVLESKAQEAEEEAVNLEDRVENMEDIATEQWIQIRHFEQALEDTQRSLEEARRTVPNFLSPILKMIDYLVANFASTAKIYALEAWYFFDALYSFARKHHHELQREIKERMKSNPMTSNYASSEVVFWVTSAIIVFPVAGSLIFLSSHFS